MVCVGLLEREGRRGWEVVVLAVPRVLDAREAREDPLRGDDADDDEGDDEGGQGESRAERCMRLWRPAEVGTAVGLGALC